VHRKINNETIIYQKEP